MEDWGLWVLDGWRACDVSWIATDGGAALRCSFDSFGWGELVVISEDEIIDGGSGAEELGAFGRSRLCESEG